MGASAAVSDAGRDLFLAGVERALQPLDDPAEIMTTVARLVGERLACDRCAYAEADPDEDHVTMTGSYVPGLPPLTGRIAMSDFSAEALRCMRAGRPYVLADAFTDARVLPEQREAYLPADRDHRRRLRAAAQERPFVAAMAVHQVTARVWTGAESALLTTVVARCWESLHRVHALNALRENEERYRVIVERASDGIWLADDDGRILAANPAACALLGYSRDEHLGLCIRDIVRPAEQPRLAALWAGRSRTEVWDLRRRDGSWMVLELSMRSAGRGRMQAIGRDITGRRRAEAERERLLERERSANHRLRLLQDATAALSAAATPPQVGAIMVTQLRHLLGVEAVAAWEPPPVARACGCCAGAWPPGRRPPDCAVSPPKTWSSPSARRGRTQRSTPTPQPRRGRSTTPSRGARTATSRSPCATSAAGVRCRRTTDTADTGCG